MSQQNRFLPSRHLPDWTLPVLFVGGVLCAGIPVLLWFVLPIFVCLGGAFLSTVLFRSFESYFDANLEWRDRLSWMFQPFKRLFSLPFWVLGVGLASLFLAVGFWWNR